MSKIKEKKRLQSSNSSTGEDDNSKIIEKLVSIQERIENGFNKMYEEIAALKYELKDDIKTVREELNEATKSLNAAWEEVSSLKEKNRILQQQLDSTAEENVKLKEDFEALRVQIVKQEDYFRRENLHLYNIPESAQETNEECVQKVKQVLSDLGASSDIKFQYTVRESPIQILEIPRHQQENLTQDRYWHALSLAWTLSQFGSRGKSCLKVLVSQLY